MRGCLGGIWLGGSQESIYEDIQALLGRRLCRALWLLVVVVALGVVVHDGGHVDVVDIEGVRLRRQERRGELPMQGSH